MPSSQTITNAAINNLEVQANFRVTSYLDDSGTSGARTVNTLRGKNAFAIGAATCTITNNLVTADSQIIVNIEFGDATLTTLLRVIPGAGSFVVTANATATAATKFSWLVVN